MEKDKRQNFISDNVKGFLFKPPFDRQVLSDRASDWAQVTIVTPSYNQAEFLENTIRSVLAQTYRGFEYIIIDGGSTDSSVEIIRKYKSQLAYWVSEPDNGQAAAVNKGFCRAQGEVLAWLNSDDLYTPLTLETIAKTFAQHPNAAIVYGDYFIIREDSSIIYKPKISFDYKICLYAYLMVPQPAAFFSRWALEKIGFLNESLKLAMDYDLILRLSQVGEVIHVPVPLAYFRLHAGSKTMTRKFGPEEKQIRERILRRSWRRSDKLLRRYYRGKAWIRFLIERHRLIINRGL